MGKRRSFIAKRSRAAHARQSEVARSRETDTNSKGKQSKAKQGNSNKGNEKSSWERYKAIHSKQRKQSEANLSRDMYFQRKAAQSNGKRPKLHSESVHAPLKIFPKASPYQFQKMFRKSTSSLSNLLPIAF